MQDTKLRFSPLRPEEVGELFFSRQQLATRWGCSEKAVLRCEKRLGLKPYRILRAIKYALSDIRRIEQESLAKPPRKFTGVTPAQKAELLRREREEAGTPQPFSQKPRRERTAAQTQ
jgi:hypothetical protein